MTDDPNQPLPTELKLRRAFEKRRGAAFTDEEWDEAKRNLVGLMLTLGMRDASDAEDE